MNAPLNGFALVQGQGTGPDKGCNLVLAHERDARIRLRVTQEFVLYAHHRWRAADPVVGTDGHHATPVCPFLVQLVEIELDLIKELSRREITPFDQQNVVVAQCVRYDDKILAIHFLNEGLIPA